MDYLKSLQDAIVFIENNLGEVTVQQVANQIGYSHYHFTRIFTAVLGEPVGSYIKSRQLADGAKKLLYTNKKIIDIALENGFQSSEAFSRAFKNKFKTSPNVYRKNRLDTIVASKEPLLQNNLNHLVENVTLTPKIKTIPPVLIAGLQTKTTLTNNTIPALWQSFQKILHTIPNKTSPNRFYGVCLAAEEDQSIFSMNPEQPFYEFAGVAVSSFTDLPKQINAHTLTGGKYAVFTHKGSLHFLPQTFGYIFGTWVINNNIIMDKRCDFEFYDERYLGFDHPSSEIDIYIPIV